MGDDRYYSTLAAAFVRGRLGQMPDLSDHEIISVGLEAGLRLHKFKQNSELPRVRRVLGILKGLVTERHLDIGSGRGTFLWPLLNNFPELTVTSIDKMPQRVQDTDAVRRGGVARLSACLMDATRLGIRSANFDTVTVLEVLEHIVNADLVIKEAIRVCRGYVIASVPSKEDANPEHVHLLSRTRLETSFLQCGARTVSFDYVPNHMIILARV